MLTVSATFYTASQQHRLGICRESAKPGWKLFGSLPLGPSTRAVISLVALIVASFSARFIPSCYRHLYEFWTEAKSQLSAIISFAS